jgi:hypothetical protein
MREHSIRASDAQFIRLFRWIAGLQISSDAKLLFARLFDLADGEQDVKASRRFLRSWLSWSDARLRRASGELEKLGWLCRKSSVTPAGDCDATEWKLPRIVIQTSETVRVEGVSYTGHGVPRKDTVSRTGQSRPHKQNTQEGGSRADARTQLRKSAEVSALGLSHAERISLERRLGQIQAELAEACRKREAARGAALFAEQCRHHSALGWTEPRPPNWLDDPGEILRPEPTGWLCVENRALPITEIDLLEIIPGRGLHIRTRQESWLISLPEDLQSDELLRAITSGEVNCLSGSCEPFMP